MLGSSSLSSLILWGPRCRQDHHQRACWRGKPTWPSCDFGHFLGRAGTAQGVRRAACAASRGAGTLLFVDEIHRFNKAQQDSFLPLMEDGTITLVGATTENPSFELNAALCRARRSSCWSA